MLDVLLRAFRFQPAHDHKDIYWNSAGISYPTIGQTSDKLALPIKIEAIEN